MFTGKYGHCRKIVLFWIFSKTKTGYNYGLSWYVQYCIKKFQFPMDSYWFEEILQKKIPKFVEKNPILITKSLISLLDESITLDNQGKGIEK